MLLDRLQGVAQLLHLGTQEIKMQVAMRLVALEFPEPLEDGRQFFFVRHSQVVGWRFGLRVRHPAERIIERMELIVQIVEGGINAFPALGLVRGGLHHSSEIDHRLNPVRTFRLHRIVACSGIEQITAATEAR